MTAQSVRRTVRMSFILAVYWTCTWPQNAAAFVSARALALAGSAVADPYGVEAALYNPAGVYRKNARIHLDLLGVSTQIYNNSFSVSDYNRYSGAYLSDVDKAYLLNRVPAGGFSLDAEAGAQALSVWASPLAITLRTDAAAVGTISRDALELLLYGNATLDTVVLSGTEAESYVTASIGASYAQPVAVVGGGALSAGVTVRYVKGFWVEEVSESRGSLITADYGIDGNAYLAARTASGGRGVAADLGLLLDYGRGWTFGASVINILGSVTWNLKPKGHLITYAVDSLSLVNAGANNLITHSNTTYDIESFSTRLPTVLRLGASRTYGALTWLAQWEQGLTRAAASSVKPRLSGGLEGWLSSTFPLRAGLTVGGGGGVGVSGGTGLHVSKFYLDLGFGLDSSPVWGKSKGFELALNLGLRF